jgi:predicted short-subunit dehydrogenase-like oxidoreductase (DUF2520 family)
MMISVVIIGNGNVGSHLYKAFLNANGISVVQINSRNLEKVPTADVTIIAVADDVIAEISSKLKNSFIVHTSGSVSIDSLENKNSKGVFYMLQTFSKNKDLNFSEVPFCLEAENNEKYLLLEKLAKSIGNKVYQVDSTQRKALHVAAVFVNNFTNHMYKMGNDICIEHQVPFEILQPLIEETAVKVKTLLPKKAQTGPAIRNDKKTIKNHLDLLNNKQKEIYTIITKSIQNGD